MFTIQKIMALIAVLSAVWAAYRFIGNLRQKSVAQQGSRNQHYKEPKSKGPNKAKVQKTLECQRCGSYVVAGTRPSCDNHQCPFPVRKSSSES
jgi:hypothetical protein